MRKQAQKVAPRIHQIPAIEAALTGLLGPDKRALVVMATGLGKMLTSGFIVQKFLAKYKKRSRVLFLIHNNHILEHAVSEYRLIFGNEVKMAVYNGLSKYGAQEADFVFATWQTMGKNLKSWARDHFDIIVVDEVHHAEAETYRPTLKYFKGAKLGLTATPDREDKANIRNVFGDEVINTTLEEAIARGWLPRIEYHVVSDKSLDEDALQKIMAEIKEGERRFTMAEVNRRIFIRKRDEEIAQVINGYKEKAVVFCGSIGHTTQMESWLDDAAMFHSQTGKNQKETWEKNQVTLKALQKGTVRRVCAVDAFNEGVNVPSVGLVAFCRATNSLTVFRQQLGRGLRPGKNKLIVLDFVGNLERIKQILEMMRRISELHESFTSEDEREREGYVREKFEVSGAGFEFTFSDEIVDLMKVLEHCEAEFYPTWEEAGEAAAKLGIETVIQYLKEKLYKQDPRLPASPHATYPNFPGYPIFLGGEAKYDTWQEASEAVIKLGIRTAREYLKKYKQDLRLPAAPHAVYPDFPGDTIFFGKKPYPTWQEASAAAKKLGIKTCTEYPKLRKKDPRLPGKLRTCYPDFPGYTAFLGGERREKKDPYPTLEEASQAVVKLGVKKSTDYPKLYKKDPRLPRHPEIFYPNFQDWKKFLQIELYPTWQEASTAAVKLGIVTGIQYQSDKLYKQDPRLPYDPETFYPEFPGWKKFLQTDQVRYSTCEEASQAAQRLKIESSRKYRQLSYQDSLLPPCPDKEYGDFPGWKKFLNKEPYPTWQKASEVTQKLGINTPQQYQIEKLYKQDRHLPSNPRDTYPDFPGWSVFLGRKKPE